MDKEKRYYNYQKFDFVRYNGQICEVRGVLDSFGINLCDKDGNEYKDVYVLDVEPIELTIDILEEIGYKYTDLFQNYVLDYGGMYGMYTSTFYPDDNKISIHSREYDVIKPNILCVHELQQLFRLGWVNYEIIDWFIFKKLGMLE